MDKYGSVFGYPDDFVVNTAALGDSPLKDSQPCYLDGPQQASPFGFFMQVFKRSFKCQPTKTLSREKKNSSD